MKLDIWMHHHRHGVDPYLMFRHDEDPLDSPDAVIEYHSIDFEADREDEYIEVHVTALDVPSNFTKAELGDLQFAMRAQRNRLQRQIQKPGAEETEHYPKNKEKLERYLALLDKLSSQEKHVVVSQTQNVPGSRPVSRGPFGPTS